MDAINGAFVINDSYNIISRRISNVGISFTHTHTHTHTHTEAQTHRQFNFFSLSDKPIGAAPWKQCFAMAEAGP
jgi:hypothetical protein